MIGVARVLLIVAIAAVLGWEVGRHHHPRCTHGVSSIGPVTVVDGHVTGDTTPHTEACLP